MITPAQAMEVIALVAACHHRTAPRMDDREAIAATARAWAELFNRQNLELPDLLAAVKHRAEICPDAPEPADIIRVARMIRRERGEREADNVRETRQEAQSRKAAADGMAAIAAVFTPGTATKRTKRLREAEAVFENFPFRPNGAHTRTHEHRQAAIDAINEYFAAKAEARKASAA